MKRQLYHQVKGGGYDLLISFKEYRKIMYEQRVSNDLVFNPFIHLIKGSFTFIHEDRVISVTIDIVRGKASFIVKDGDEVLMDIRRITTFYKFNKVQIDYWNMFAVPLAFHLKELNLIDEVRHCTILYYPPILSGRKQWDVMEVRTDYYIHNVGDNRWCLYHWVSGQNEVCMDEYVSGDDINAVIDEFNIILDDMDIIPADESNKWWSVTYNQDGSFYTKKC